MTIWYFAGLMLAIAMLAGYLQLRAYRFAAHPRTPLDIDLRIGAALCFPAVQFASLWSVLLIGLACSGSDFREISIATLAVYTIGALSFCAGALLAGPLKMPEFTAARARERRPLILRRRINEACIVFFVGCIPWYWGYLNRIARTDIYTDFWWGVRAALVDIGEQAGRKGMEQFLFDNIAGATILLTYVAFLDAERTWPDRVRRVSLLLLALFYNLSTASRSGAFAVVLGLIGLSILRRRGISIRAAAVAIALLVSVYVPAAVTMKKGVDTADNGGGYIQQILRSARLYAFGGVVAFDQAVVSDGAIESTWTLDRSFRQLASRIGFDVEFPPSTHLQFVDVGNDQMANVYTTYHSYYTNYGYGGVIVIMSVLGWTLTRLTYAALSGRPAAELFYAIAFGSVVLTGFNEGFASNLNLWLKAGVTALVLYVFPDRHWGGRAIHHSAGPTDVAAGA